MTTFADLKTRIADELNRDDINTQIGQNIVRAINHYEVSRWWFSETQWTITSSTASVALPTDLMILDSVEAYFSSRWLPVNEIGWKRYQEEWSPVTSTNVPCDYSEHQDLLWLGPAPNQDYALRLSGAKFLATLSADGDSNAWTTFGEDLIASRAAAVIAKRILRLPDSEVLAFLKDEIQGYAKLCTLNVQRVTTGQARPWS